MPTQAGVLNAITLNDAATGCPAQLATTQDMTTLEHTLNVQAVGITTSVTLSPTNLALEAGNLATLRIALAPIIGISQVITVGATHHESTTVGVTVIRLFSTVDCHVVIGSAPVAGLSDTFLPAKTSITVSCLTTSEVSVIADSTTGSLYVTPLT